MGKVIVYKDIIVKKDGTKDVLAIVYPAPGYQKTMADLAAEVVPSGISYEIIDESDIPTDRTFRDAWDISNNKIDVDLIKAKNIARKMDPTKTGRINSANNAIELKSILDSN